jgi:hypothetical protein
MNPHLTPDVPFELRLALQQIPPATQPSGLEVLHIPVEWMRYCEVCDSEQCFIARWRCESGLVCQCTRCSDTRVAPYTRTDGGINDPNEPWEAYT